jgi:hypothetical protein
MYSGMLCATGLTSSSKILHAPLKKEEHEGLSLWQAGSIFGFQQFMSHPLQLVYIGILKGVDASQSMTDL